MTINPPNSHYVSPSWIQSHLDEIQKNSPSIRLIEINCDPKTYVNGHIPGALAINWDREMSQIPGSHRIEKEVFEEVMSKCGVTENTILILYGDYHNRYAFHAFWVCWHFGHEMLHLMNGGKSQWEQEGFEFTKKAPSVSETAYTVNRKCDGVDYGIIGIS